MNCDGSNQAIRTLIEAGWRDTYEAVHGMADPGHTFHEFRGAAHVAEIGRIDWIFVRGSARAIEAELVTDSRAGRFPSDHYFVTADLAL
jgi:endonuclease/exonuclease/phosphatase family metal-dependent hydrolase